MSVSSRQSMESLKGHRAQSKVKLWVDVPPQLSRTNLSTAHPGSRDSLAIPVLPSPSVFTRLSTNQHTIKPTLTTLLRQNQLLARDEKREKEKVDGFIRGASSGHDYEDWKGRKEYEAKKEAEARGAKKILQARLAYHKAKAAAQNVVSSNYEKALILKYEREKLKKEVDAAIQADNERKRAIAAEIHDEFHHSKQHMEEVKEAKRKQAEEMKQQTMKLQDESRWKEQQLLKEKREKIKQIQAGKVAVKVSKKKFSTPSFLTDIGSPDAEILIKLAKESHAAQLEEKRHKVLQAKEERQKKLQELEKKMEIVNKRNSDHRQLRAKATSIESTFPKVKDTFVDDEELQKLQEELQRFTKSHTQGRSRSCAAPTTRNSSFRSPSSSASKSFNNYKDNNYRGGEFPSSSDTGGGRWPVIRKP